MSTPTVTDPRAASSIRSSTPRAATNDITPPDTESDPAGSVVVVAVEGFARLPTATTIEIGVRKRDTARTLRLQHRGYVFTPRRPPCRGGGFPWASPKRMGAPVATPGHFPPGSVPLPPSYGALSSPRWIA